MSYMAQVKVLPLCPTPHPTTERPQTTHQLFFCHSIIQNGILRLTVCFGGPRVNALTTQEKGIDLVNPHISDPNRVPTSEYSCNSDIFDNFGLRDGL